MKHKIKNWEAFQQYKDNRPLHWIKLHTKLLADYSFNQLSEISQLHLIKLWLLAAENQGEVEGDEAWLAKRIDTKKLNLSALVQAGFLIRTDSYENVPREEKRREEENREDETRGEKNIIALTRDADLIFDHWRGVMDHPKAAFDDKRKALIRKHLKNYSPDDLKAAITGCALTPFNMGDNDRGQRYDALSVIFKDSDQIDRFISNAANPPTKGKRLQQSIAENDATAKRIREAMENRDAN